MQYLTQGQLLTQAKFRANSRSTVTIPWSDDEVRQAVSQAVMLAYPVGRQTIVTMTKAGYDATSQTMSIDGAAASVPAKPALLHIRQIEVLNSAGIPTILDPGIHYQFSPYDAKFLYLYGAMGASETLRINGILGVQAPSGTSEAARTADDAVTIHLEPDMLINYMLYVLYQLQSRHGAAAARMDESQNGQMYLARAETRKALLFQQQYGAILPQIDEKKK